MPLFFGRCLHAHWHRPAAVDGLSGHGSLLCVCGALLSSAQVVSPEGLERCWSPSRLRCLCSQRVGAHSLLPCSCSPLFIWENHKGPEWVSAVAFQHPEQETEHLPIVVGWALFIRSGAIYMNTGQHMIPVYHQSSSLTRMFMD